MSWTLDEDDAALETALDSLAGATEIAVDTEFMRRNTYYPQVALLQLCAGDSAWLIDPLRITRRCERCAPCSRTRRCTKSCIPAVKISRCSATG
jgi:ribonuclease D